jgi:phosphatidylserine/phosphatidylglycerophosphate/cardiolipin synthase-like enzyme
MKRTTLPAVLALLAALLCASHSHAQTIRSYFSPNGGTAAAIIAEINNAHTSIDIAAYEITYTPIVTAILAAKQRGVSCRIIIDPKADNSKAKNLRALNAAAIPIRADHHEKLMHNKYAILDATTLITGSYNWSNDAELRNAENTLILRDPQTIADFAADFANHWNHSIPTTPGPPGIKRPTTPRANTFTTPTSPPQKE